MRGRRLFEIGSWCFVVVGSGHLLIMALSAMRGPTAEVRRAHDAMRAATVSMFGLDRDVSQLFYGFSGAMGLLGIGIGVLSLVAARQVPQLLTRGRALVWIDLVIALVLLAVSILAFPPPPIVVLAVAAVAFGLALASGRAVPATEPEEVGRGAT
jgi:hypothetical protein